MNVLCSATACPVLLSTTCVFYEGENLIYTGINTNDSVQEALQKIDEAFSNNILSINAILPISITSGPNPTISISQASATSNGYISSVDWNIFNNKVPSTRTLTINGTTYDLSANRSWTIPSDNIYNIDGTLTGNRTVSSGGFSLTLNPNTNLAGNLFGNTLRTRNSFSGSYTQNGTVFADSNYIFDGLTFTGNTLYMGQSNIEVTGGSTTVQTQGIDIEQHIKLSGGTSRISASNYILQYRGYSGDISTNSGSVMLGLSISTGHNKSDTTTSIVTGGVTGNAANIFNYVGTINNAYGYSSTLNATTSASHKSSTITNYISFRSTAVIGATSGTSTATITNYYGIYLDTPAVRLTGTITNRWGVYAPDVAMNHYINGTFLIGTTTPSTFKLDVNGTARVGGPSISAQLYLKGGVGTGQYLYLDNGGSDLWTIIGGNVFVIDSSSTRIFRANANAQVTINGSSVNNSAQFQVDSTTRGFLQPRMTTTQRDAIVSPATGLQVYNTTTNTNDYYNGTSWLSEGNVTGSGATGQVAYWNGTSSQTGSATLTYTPTTSLLVNNSVTAASAIARGTNLTPTLTASANNDVLVGLDINTTFNNGAFTGVSNMGLRIGARISSVDRYFNFISPSSSTGIGTIDAGGSNFLYLNAGGGITLQYAGSTVVTTASATTFRATTDNWVNLGGGNTSFRWANVYSVNYSGDNYTFKGEVFAAQVPVNTGIQYDTTNKILRFYTNNSEKYRLTSAGRLLLGTTTESTFILDVNGTARVSENNSSGVLSIANSNLSASVLIGSFLAANTTDDSYISVGKSLTNSNCTILGNAYSSGVNYAYITTQGGSGANFSVVSNGRVGIGTISPKNKLDVFGTISITNTSASGYGEFMFYENTTLKADIIVNGSSQTAFGGANSLNIYQASNAATTFYTNATERMRLTAAGRLLLGTTTESTYLLDVNGTARVSGAMRFDNAVEFRSTNGNTKFTVQANTGWNTTISTGSFGSAGIRFGDGAFANVLIGSTSDSFNGSAMLDLRSNSLGLYLNRGTISTMPNLTSWAGITLSIVGGSGYTNGTYNGVSATGNYFGTVAVNVTISGGAVTSISLFGGGSKIQLGETFTIPAASIGGTGSGMSFTITAINNQNPAFTFYNTTNNFLTYWDGVNYATPIVSKLDRVLIGSTGLANLTSILELSSSTQGFLPPRMTTTQKNAISSPAAGLQVYDSTTNAPNYYDGTAWVALGGGGASIYTANGTLTSNRTVSSGGFSLVFNPQTAFVTTLNAAPNDSTTALVSQNTLSYASGFSSTNIGNVYGAVAGINLQTFAGSATFETANLATAVASVNSIDFSSSGSTITMTQPVGGGIRAMTGHQSQIQYQGTNSGTITHAAISQNLGFYRPSAATGILTITNAYSLLINSLSDYGAGFTFTNRWGIYQDGASDNNYFKGKVIIGSTDTVGVSPLNVKNLPTSSAGLATGDIWNDSGTLKIV